VPGQMTWHFWFPLRSVPGTEPAVSRGTCLDEVIRGTQRGGPPHREPRVAEQPSELAELAFLPAAGEHHGQVHRGQRMGNVAALGRISTIQRRPPGLIARRILDKIVRQACSSGALAVATSPVSVSTERAVSIWTPSALSECVSTSWISRAIRERSSSAAARRCQRGGLRRLDPGIAPVPPREQRNHKHQRQPHRGVSRKSRRSARRPPP